MNKRLGTAGLQGKPGAFKDALKCVWRPEEMVGNA